MINNKEKDKILVLCDHYKPGFRAGGPITTLSNMVSQLSSYFDYYVVSRDRDLLSNKPYNIELNQWVKHSDSYRYYIGKRKLSFSIMKKLIKETAPRVIYLNSFFSYRFSITIILLYKLRLINKCKIIICPRGEFKKSALSRGQLKKRLYIKLSRIFSFYSKVLWQATNKDEQTYIKNIFGKNIKSIVVSNITRSITKLDELKYSNKNVNSLKLVYVGRIHRIKNLLFNLEILSNFKGKGKINFDIIGSVEDEKYWEICKTKIQSMPDNIRVNYLGDMPNDEVIRKLKQYHFLFLLTLGENFGQSIFEALSVGLPVIISDQTPWQSLQLKNAGWSISLASKDIIIKVLNKCIKMSQTNYNTYVKGSLKFALDYDYNSGTFEANKAMFSTALESS